ncbi:hypothetical protein SAMN05444004_106209 [Jannaschia faecimaris]|uniref:DUF1223 domain-containing protein n=1 Tax=Jannaschia faecimaris TaxID=1244108 RepID=A0A1H3QM35_9RHOB|nr:DUF1223 domain-containing protein [Jannaschia faecimaris]SDZ14437.1 hypothetical protein SAMN05444004_106209 [Jannaschia faecimaris]
MRLASATLTMLALAIPAAADPVVVELYTSQGCSSCPPADAMLGELTTRDNVIALSLHVDYWDWIGWKDTFADPAFSERQLLYANVVGSNMRYTPQFVVGGVDRVAGPSAMELFDLIQSHDGATNDVLQADGTEVTVTATGQAGQLIAVTYRPKATVEVLHGENAGHSITYHNIVRSWTVLREWDGSATTVSVPPAGDGYSLVVLAQAIIDGKPGPMLGAVKLD